MTQKPKIAVLLATHHPSEYVLEQIESIKNQELVEPIIYWGDFNSTQEELEMLKSALAGVDHRVFAVQKAGPAANFFKLLENCNERFIAFADQDDIWLPRKLYTQYKMLEEVHEVPALIHSNSLLLEGNVIRTKRNLCHGHSFDDLAFTNCCQGCTMLINQEARLQILKNLPKDIIWHDWWIALVVSLTGRVLFSIEPDTIYRLHVGNTIGIPTRLRRLYRYLDRPRGQVRYQIVSAIRIFSNHPLILTNSRRYQRMLSDNFFERLLGVISDKKRRSNIFEELARRILWVIKIP